jgi:hypothetical protein
MRAGKAFASGASHIFGVGLQALVIAAIVVALAFAAAVVVGSSPAGADSVFAAKGGNGGANGGGGGSGSNAGSTGGAGIDSITVGASGGTALRATQYVYGETVATWSTLGRDYDYVYARVQCFANSSSVATVAIGQQMYDVFQVVKEGTWASFASAFPTTASAGWSGGGGDCTATLLNAVWKGGVRTYSPLASAAFSVAP